MEPLMSYDGYMMLQDDTKSRDLLSNFFKDKGYTIVSPQTNNQETEFKANNEKKDNRQ